MIRWRVITLFAAKHSMMKAMASGISHRRTRGSGTVAMRRPEPGLQDKGAASPVRRRTASAISEWCGELSGPSGLSQSSDERAQAGAVFAVLGRCGRVDQIKRAAHRFEKGRD